MSWLKQRKAPSTKVAEVSKVQPQLRLSARKPRPRIAVASCCCGQYWTLSHDLFRLGGIKA